MFLLKRLTPLLVFLVIIAGSELLFVRPKWIAYILAVQFILILILWHNFTWPKVRAKITFLILPLLLIIGYHFFVLILGNPLHRQIVLFGVAFLVYFYLENLYVFFYRTAKYQINALDTISEYASLVAAFFFYASFFGLRVFLNYPIAPLILGVFLVGFLLIYKTFWLNKVSVGHNLLYSGVGGVLLAQAFWAILLLPTSFYVNGAALVALYYAFANLSLAFLQGQARRKTVLKFILISLISIILLFSTAAWI